jgi:hypothetical protein
VKRRIGPALLLLVWAALPERHVLLYVMVAACGLN